MHVPANQSADTNELAVATAVSEFLNNLEQRPDVHTCREYRLVMEAFRDLFPGKRLAELVRQDVLDFKAHLIETGSAPEEVLKRLNLLDHLFTANNLPLLLKAEDKPRWVSAPPPELLAEAGLIFTPYKANALVAAADQEFALLMQVLLGAGLREFEVCDLKWSDVDCQSCVLVVRPGRLDNGPVRNVPIPPTLVAALERLQSERNASPSDFIFPDSQGRPMYKLERRLKRLAHRANLNCGRCRTSVGTCADGPRCFKIGIPIFRRTFAVNALQKGVNLVTLQSWLGHSSIESTMRMTGMWVN